MGHKIRVARVPRICRWFEAAIQTKSCQDYAGLGNIETGAKMSFNLLVL
jgi:hypothetical protein